MFAVNSYKNVIEILENAFTEPRYKHKSNITGIVFARPETELTKTEIIPHIDYWFRRSDNYTDFFCGGYAVSTMSEMNGLEHIKQVKHKNWFYSTDSFVEFTTEIEAISTWKYKGGVELILTNAYFDEIQNKAFLDFSNALTIELELAKKQDAILTVPHLFETVFEFAKKINESNLSPNPAWNLSDILGVKLIKNTLKEGLLAFLPKAISDEARKAFHFTVTDIERKN
jgi:hypothetical protein